ncbi:MAG TPA: hypothetical protein VJB12_06405, partial [Candidatus Nanoarchaeia archaeon]|nr:hypothetical protein [Candidatus Nanoarchaeia archaeon]
MISRIEIGPLVEKRLTYPNWNTGSEYALLSKKAGRSAEIYYVAKGKRRFGRKFPQDVQLTVRFSYALGLLKGEGSNALGKSNYRRFTITNSDPKVIKFLLEELENTGLLQIPSLKKGSLHLLHHTSTDEDVVRYWSKQLELPKKLFRTFDDKTKTTPFGVCHVYISDVLLRRVVDLLHEKIMGKSI